MFVRLSVILAMVSASITIFRDFTEEEYAEYSNGAD